MWNPNSSTRRRRSASGPSAMRAPRLARRLASISSRSASRPFASSYAGLAVALEQVLEALADEAELAAVGLVEVLVADLERERRQLALVALDRAQQLVGDRDHARRDADRARELPHLDAVARERQPAGARRATRGRCAGRPRRLGERHLEVLDERAEERPARRRAGAGPAGRRRSPPRRRAPCRRRTRRAAACAFCVQAKTHGIARRPARSGGARRGAARGASRAQQRRARRWA